MNTGHLSVEGKIASATEKKEEGNVYFKTNEVRKAIKKYHISLLYLKDIENASPLDKLAGIQPKKISVDELANIKSLRSICYNNLAACILKSNNYGKVVNYTTKVLEIDECNTKALFRRGQAFFHLKNIDKAEDDFKKIKSINPKETCCDSFFPMIKSQKERQNLQEKAMYRKMMETGAT